jgi:hypothetical protein
MSRPLRGWSEGGGVSDSRSSFGAASPLPEGEVAAEARVRDYCPLRIDLYPLSLAALDLPRWGEVGPL